jgi:protocatechuate 3,4-dioxygenase beta subunit
VFDVNAHRHSDHDDFGGLHRDAGIMSRRRALVLVGLGAAGFAACSGSDETSSTTGFTSGSTTSAARDTTAPSTAPSGTAVGDSTAATDTTAATVTCDATPSETEGPFPADGNGGRGNVDVLGDGSVVRADIRTSSDGSSTAPGVPLRIRLDVLDRANGCAPLAGAAVYVWHCTADGAYSLYSSGVEDVDFLRGVQASAPDGGDGVVEFVSIFPGCYDGRWPHIHFEVFRSLDEATNGANAILVSQVAFRQDVCEQVYADAAYGSSADNLGRVSIADDNIFSDGVDSQLGAMSGTLGSDDFTVSLNVVV